MSWVWIVDDEREVLNCREVKDCMHCFLEYVNTLWNGEAFAYSATITKSKAHPGREGSLAIASHQTPRRTFLHSNGPAK